MQNYCYVLLLICCGVPCRSFAVDTRFDELTSAMEITAEMQTLNEMTSILTVNDFLIEGDADYQVDGDNDHIFVNGDNADDEDVDYFDGRIVGGNAATIQQFPHQISLQYNKVHICGGTLVAPSLVITAAHCVETPASPKSYRVRAGSSQHKHGGQLVDVRRIIRHEQYSTTTLDNDIAIILLAARLSFNQNVQAITIAKQVDTVPTKKRLYVSGWGLTSETGSVMPVLRYVAVRVLNITVCTQRYEAIKNITTRMFCAGSAEGGRDSCQGDSGGPLVAYEDGKAKLYGVVSWGVGCAQKDFPGVYVKISTLRSWINDKVKMLRAIKEF